MTNSTLRLVVIVAFRDEEDYLPTFLESVAAQSHPPELLVLVDDGSRDSSREIAEAFARGRTWVEVLGRAPRRAGADRLADGSVVQAFHDGVRSLTSPWDIIGKVDADLRLDPELLGVVRQRFATDAALGMTGSFLSVEQANGVLRREHHPVCHVHGPNKFYRRACFEQIAPLPEMPGWDTIDELRARVRGWKTTSFSVTLGETVHLRPMGTHDGLLRAYRRWGRCAWSYGAHPLWVLLGAVYRMPQKPYLVGGLSYLWGWIQAGCGRVARAERETLQQARTENLADLRARLGRLVPRRAL